MTNAEWDRKVRFRQLFEVLNLDRQVVASQLGYKKKYLDQILSAKKNLSDAVALKFSKRYNRVNSDWLLYGKGEMLIESVVKDYQIDHRIFLVEEPKMSDVDALHDAVLARYKPDPVLTLKQDLTLRQACLQVLTDNPGQPFTALLVGAGVYLKYIQAYPNMALPE